MSLMQNPNRTLLCGNDFLNNSINHVMLISSKRYLLPELQVIKYLEFFKVLWQLPYILWHKPQIFNHGTAWVELFREISLFRNNHHILNGAFYQVWVHF